ncbi:hypothetical protein [Mycolicibacterium celeriflavum]|uniref:hypothetical protein n=1 Tax=Mycolicibacterium celeriflavum TaxID=1249101 RepID=UPI003CECDFF4
MDMTLLFAVGHLATALATTTKSMVQHLQKWDPDDLLRTPVEDVVDVLVDKALVNCPRLLVDQAWMTDPTETSQEYMEFGERRRVRVPRFVLVVPFEGDSGIFTLRADQFTFNPIHVLALRANELHIAVDNPPRDAAGLKSRFEEQIARIEEHLEWSRRQVELHNKAIRQDVPGIVTRRRDELLAARHLQAEVGFPVRRRSDAETYAVPMRRKTIRPQQQRPSNARAPFTPEPALQDQDYREALRVLRIQRNALERSPSMAATLKEEQIRDLLLVNLNAQFEGDAAGEVFNGAGKTDILIRVHDRNIFIGECKVWSGPKTMDEALDQLFGYLVWRDTKAAILLFIRRKDVTAVIKKAIAKIEEHPNHKRSSPRQSCDEEYEFVMHAQDDVEREIHLTLIPFAVRAAADG